MILDLIRPHLKDMEGYSSAGMEAGKDASKLFLNANENPYELPGLEGFNRYPEPQPPKLVQAMAQFYGVDKEGLIVTRGADEGIAILTRLFVEPGKDSILINPPTFGVYKTYANVSGGDDVISVPLLKEEGTFKLDVAGIKKALNNKNKTIKMIYITNPNNPTGNCFEGDDILDVIKAAKDKAAVILDETYAEFKPDQSLTSRLKDFPNLIILRTLSKSFALAGMRLGAILSGQKDLMDTIRTKVMEVYPIPVASVKAGLHVLSDDIMSIAQGNIQKLIDERKRMEAFLKGIKGVRHVYPSDANFLLVEMDRANDFHAYAQDRKVILRNFANKPDTKNCLRISIGMPDHNDLVMTMIKDFYA
jgi:histidinol-phosphate aminotransferase